MSYETKPSTAEEILNEILSAAYQVLEGDISKNDFFKSGGPKLRDWVDHQIATMREEAEFRANTADFFMEDRQRHRELCKELALKNKKCKEELAELKEAAKGQMRAVQVAMHQVDEAVKLLKRTLDTLSEDPTKSGIVTMEITNWLSRRVQE